jgi:hypothetical protein
MDLRQLRLPTAKTRVELQAELTDLIRADIKVTMAFLQIAKTAADVDVSRARDPESKAAAAMATIRKLLDDVDDAVVASKLRHELDALAAQGVIYPLIEVRTEGS